MSLPGRLRRRGNVRTALRKDAASTVLRSRKVASNRLEYVVAWTHAQERQGTRDAGSTVQRSRKVATNHHEYVTAWTPAQERQGTTLRRDAGSILQRSRKLTVMSTSLPGGLRRRGKVPCCAGMLDLLCRDRGRSLLTIISTSLSGSLCRRGKVYRIAQGCWLYCAEIEEGRY